MYNITEIEVIIANHEITLNTTYVYHLHTGEFISGLSRVQSPVNGTSSSLVYHSTLKREILTLSQELR